MRTVQGPNIDSTCSPPQLATLIVYKLYTAATILPHLWMFLLIFIDVIIYIFYATTRYSIDFCQHVYLYVHIFVFNFEVHNVNLIFKAVLLRGEESSGTLFRAPSRFQSRDRSPRFPGVMFSNTMVGSRPLTSNVISPPKVRSSSRLVRVPYSCLPPPSPISTCQVWP